MDEYIQQLTKNFIGFLADTGMSAAQSTWVGHNHCLSNQPFDNRTSKTPPYYFNKTNSEEVVGRIMAHQSAGKSISG